MTTARTASQRGAWSRNKGAKAERDLVAYLRTVGFSDAERAVRTGYRTQQRAAADPGDVTGTPGVVWSVKDAAAERLADWFAELDAMDGAMTDVRLLVHKRTGKADPGRWWCWTRVDTLLVLAAGGPWASCTAPVRMELGHVVPLLRAAGYGDRPEVAS